MRKAAAYLASRLNERSTWADIIAGCSAAAILPAPWNYASMAAAIVKALIPDGPVKGSQK